MSANTVSNLVENFRNDRGLTQEELAEKAGVDQSMIAALGTGRQRADVFMLSHARAIARALGPTVDEIFPIPSR